MIYVGPVDFSMDMSDEELTAQAEAVFRGVDNIVAESDDNADL